MYNQTSVTIKDKANTHSYWRSAPLAMRFDTLSKSISKYKAATTLETADINSKKPRLKPPKAPNKLSIKSTKLEKNNPSNNVNITRLNRLVTLTKPEVYKKPMAKNTPMVAMRAVETMPSPKESS